MSSLLERAAIERTYHAAQARLYRAMRQFKRVQARVLKARLDVQAATKERDRIRAGQPVPAQPSAPVPTLPQVHSETA